MRRLLFTLSKFYCNVRNFSIIPKLLKQSKISVDNVAIKGGNDVLFLYEGSNRYFQMYFDPIDVVKESAERWARSVSIWEESVKSKKSEFCFILVPNKASLLRHSYPLSLPMAETPYLENLRKKVHVSLFKPKSPIETFRKNDTHLSPMGNIEFCNFILVSLGINIQYHGLIFVGANEFIGDLGSKFEPPISELVKFHSLTDDFSKPQIISDNSLEYLPSRHVGISIRLSNANAPVNKTLRVFGNSFLGVATEYSTLWLLGTVFQNVMFEWSPKVNLDAVGENEIVIFQTCERFLGYSPDHWG